VPNCPPVLHAFFLRYPVRVTRVLYRASPDHSRHTLLSLARFWVALLRPFALPALVPLAGGAFSLRVPGWLFLALLAGVCWASASWSSAWLRPAFPAPSLSRGLRRWFPWLILFSAYWSRSPRAVETCWCILSRLFAAVFFSPRAPLPRVWLAGLALPVAVLFFPGASPTPRPRGDEPLGRFSPLASPFPPRRSLSCALLVLARLSHDRRSSPFCPPLCLLVCSCFSCRPWLALFWVSAAIRAFLLARFVCRGLPFVPRYVLTGRAFAGFARRPPPALGFPVACFQVPRILRCPVLYLGLRPPALPSLQVPLSSSCVLPCVGLARPSFEWAAVPCVSIFGLLAPVSTAFSPVHRSLSTISGVYFFGAGRCMTPVFLLLFPWARSPQLRSCIGSVSLVAFPCLLLGFAYAAFVLFLQAPSSFALRTFACFFHSVVPSPFLLLVPHMRGHLAALFPPRAGGGNAARLLSLPSFFLHFPARQAQFPHPPCLSFAALSPPPFGLLSVFLLTLALQGVCLPPPSGPPVSASSGCALPLSAPMAPPWFSSICRPPGPLSVLFRTCAFSVFLRPFLACFRATSRLSPPLNLCAALPLSAPPSPCRLASSARPLVYSVASLSSCPRCSAQGSHSSRGAPLSSALSPLGLA